MADDVFAAVYIELWNWVEHKRDFGRLAGDSCCMGVLRHELLSFPKTRAAAMCLHEIDGIGYGHGILVAPNGDLYTWQQDPVIGAIVRNRNFYAWKRNSLIGTAHDRSTSDDLLQGAR